MVLDDDDGMAFVGEAVEDVGELGDVLLGTKVPGLRGLRCQTPLV